MTADSGQRERDTPRRARSQLRSRLLTFGGRLVADLLCVGLWALAVTLLALSAAWARWQFYSLLVLGVVCYVLVTVPWGQRGAD